MSGIAPTPPAQKRSKHRAWRFAGSMLLPLAIIGGFTLAALLAGRLYPGDPLEMVATPLLWPFEDSAFPLGTDSLGRDLAAGLAHGARITLLVGGFSAAIGLLIGALVGTMAGYLGGATEAVMMKITEIFQTIPPLLLVIVILAAGGPSIGLIILAIGVSSWPMIARLARAEVRALRGAEFVQAARVLGLGSAHIVAFEILPNALPSLIVATSVLVANSILLEAGISFLNLGDPNLVSWGSMIGAGRSSLRTEWYLTAIPGMAIVAVVLALNILGDRLTDYLNPRMGQR